jgi:hypothetical protein
MVLWDYKKVNSIFQHSRRHKDGRWHYASRNGTYWLHRAKEMRSPSHYFLGITLLAMETWEIIGVPNAQDRSTRDPR